ncbi:MAG: PIN domain-containing protein [Pyrinomonadaceae bacterium]
MNLVSLDSNVILRFVLNDIPELAARAEDFVGRSRCYVTDVVIAECVFVLEKVYKFDRSYIAYLMSILFRLDTVIYNEIVMKQTFDLYMRSRPLSFVDCYSVIEAAQARNLLVTFDRKIVKKSDGIAKEP